MCFAIAGALVPLIEIITGELFAQYATLATISVLNCAALYATFGVKVKVCRTKRLRRTHSSAA